MSKWIYIGSVVVVVATAMWVYTHHPRAPLDEDNAAYAVVARNLDTPWGVALLPGGGMLVTQRPGVLTDIAKDGTHKDILVEGVVERGEGGLLGIAPSPTFSTDHQVYMYMTMREGDTPVNRVVRYVYEGGVLTDPTFIVDDIPGNTYHNGGALAFGPDGNLYVTTGDAQDEASAQDTTSLAGKILRVHKDGSVPIDNPFNNAVYSYGHRNPQGLAWDAQGQLWAVEHGRSGVQSGYDELNLIVRGTNYGWPTIEGDETKTGMQPPALQSGAATTWAPSGLVYSKGVLYFGGLKGQGVYAAKVAGTQINDPAKYYDHVFGRVRVAAAQGGALFITTSNKDGRGEPGEEDDLLIRLNLSDLTQ